MSFDDGKNEREVFYEHEEDVSSLGSFAGSDWNGSGIFWKSGEYGVLHCLFCTGYGWGSAVSSGGDCAVYAAGDCGSGDWRVCDFSGVEGISFDGRVLADDSVSFGDNNDDWGFDVFGVPSSDGASDGWR